MDKLLQDKVCVVTGGSKGIGRAIVELFASQGGRVYYFSRSETENAAALTQKAAASGGAVSWIACDVSDEKQVDAAVEAVIKEAGFIDALVNNAGVTRDGLVFRMSLEDWNTVITTNLTSAFLVSRVAARHMIKRRSGCIVNVSSVVGITGNGGQTNYAASKAGVIGFTKSLAREVASRGVRVNAIAPGYIDTSMTEKIPEEAKEKLKATIPLGRTGTGEDVAKAALYLCSDLSSYVTGEILKVDGGMGM
ncbi:MAG TPA: 3-oxoacyl-[acyl-carrier-protein] reductase [Rectinemataceae bacterium]|nr:3-oxoacyl-[acyl-carrier-protein] reductase [Rectinemataceae bacterium]